MEITHEQIQRTLEMIAQREGISADEVALCIDESIADAYYTALLRENHQILNRFSQISHNGTIPDAFEIIAYMVECVRQEMRDN